MTRLAGKVAIVTGSTSGIGLGIARGLAEAGASIVLNGLGEAQLIQSLVREMRGAGAGEAIHHPADMQLPEEIAALVQSAVERFGRLDILVNNAGISRRSSISRPSAGTRSSPSTSPLRSMRSGRRCRKCGARVGGGSSTSPRRTGWSPRASAYVAAKHGVVGLTKVAALEAGGSGITCNAICPAWVLTPLVQKQIDTRAEAFGGDQKAAIRQMMQSQPSGEFIRPDQIAGLVLFLCSDAAAQITGAAITIDGGWTAQ